jgi:peptidoglycan/LPS O-acetylase OafA/YrhL
LQRKTAGAQKLLPFSFLRNGVHLNTLPRGQRTSSLKEANLEKEKRLSAYLSVFNGLKGSAVIAVVWGQTFFFSWFSIINNPDEVTAMMKDSQFNMVSAVTFCASVFFFCSGFLQTYSFLQHDQEESMFTPKNLGLHYLKKLLRYMPLNVLCPTQSSASSLHWPPQITF